MEESHLAAASEMMESETEALRVAGELETALIPAYYAWLRNNRKNGVNIDSETSALANFIVALIMPLNDLDPTRALGAFKILSVWVEAILMGVGKNDQAR